MGTFSDVSLKSGSTPELQGWRVVQRKGRLYASNRPTRPLKPKTSNTMKQLPLPDPCGQPIEQDVTPLLDWLRDQTKCDIFCDFETTGSRRFFGTGNDTDFLIDITKIPAELRHLIPPPRFGDDTQSDYGGCVSIIHDETHPQHGNVDFVIASPERTEEFKYATEHFCSMRRDPLVTPEVWQLLQDNKPLRIAVFRALRRSFPNSTLTH